MTMKPMSTTTRALLASLLALAAGVAAAPARAVAPAATAGIAWIDAAAPADIAGAFARARSANKPLLLYWGASWCPPCNQLKATLFNRADFAALSRSFVAVQVDGDRPGAQKLGQQFSVRGYPTLVLFRPDGSEITRLPGEADAAQVVELLRLGLAGGRPVRQVLADARAGKPVGASEWRLLAFYSWETDDAQLLGGTDAATVLVELALASEAAGATAGAETATRLWLKAVAASDEGKGLKADEALRARVGRVLSDPVQLRAQGDVVVNFAPGMVRALTDTPQQREPLVAAFDAALGRLQADAGLSRADRLTALLSRLELARIDEPKDELRPALPHPLVAEVRDWSARLDREVTDGYERQAVIPTAAHALQRAGLWAESESLLLANLARSHSPYYLMSQLGGAARKLGRSDDALRWYARAFDSSRGPATRLQWGAGYLQALVDLAPADAARIERVVGQLLDEAAQDSGAFYKRSAASLKRVARALQSWNRDGAHAASMRRLQGRLDQVCAKVDAGAGGKAECRALLAPAAAAG